MCLDQTICHTENIPKHKIYSKHSAFNNQNGVLSIQMSNT